VSVSLSTDIRDEQLVFCNDRHLPWDHTSSQARVPSTPDSTQFSISLLRSLGERAPKPTALEWFNDRSASGRANTSLDIALHPSSRNHCRDLSAATTVLNRTGMRFQELEATCERLSSSTEGNEEVNAGHEIAEAENDRNPSSTTSPEELPSIRSSIGSCSSEHGTVSLGGLLLAGGAVKTSLLSHPLEPSSMPNSATDADKKHDGLVLRNHHDDARIENKAASSTQNSKVLTNKCLIEQASSQHLRKLENKYQRFRKLIFQTKAELYGLQDENLELKQRVKELEDRISTPPPDSSVEIGSDKSTALGIDRKESHPSYSADTPPTSPDLTPELASSTCDLSEKAH
jgi:hypothetical protein